jgi:hypothetical protein
MRKKKLEEEELQKKLLEDELLKKKFIQKKVVEDYDKEDDDEISIKENDIVDVLEPVNESGWVLVKNLRTNETGFVPESFLE